MTSKTLLPLAVLLVAGLAVLGWISRGVGRTPPTADVPGGSAAQSAPASPVLQRPTDLDTPRGSEGSASAPGLAAAKIADRVEEPIQPRVVEPEVDPRDTDYPPVGGIAATALVVLGGPEAFLTTYEKYGAQEREDRMLELETALAEYVQGEPKDEAGKARYAAFKDELYWWRANRR